MPRPFAIATRHPLQKTWYLIIIRRMTGNRAQIVPTGGALQKLAPLSQCHVYRKRPTLHINVVSYLRALCFAGGEPILECGHHCLVAAFSGAVRQPFCSRLVGVLTKVRGQQRCIREAVRTPPPPDSTVLLKLGMTVMEGLVNVACCVVLV